MATSEPFQQPGIRGFLHRPAKLKAAMLLSHGAGGDSRSPLMVAVASAFCEAGYCVLRWDLPFRQRGGSPGGSGEKDRAGIREAVKALRAEAPRVPVYLAGQSYGGRQSSMVAAEDAKIADALLLLSYPLHPPGNPGKTRTEHFPSLQVPALFVHGTRDPFGSIHELQEAIKLIPAKTALKIVQGAGHGVPPKTGADLPEWFAASLRDDG